MKTLIVYDSVFDNTEQIAQAISNSPGSKEHVETLQGDIIIAIPTDQDFLLELNHVQTVHSARARDPFLKIEL